jgi:hypothetical protein
MAEHASGPFTALGRVLLIVLTGVLALLTGRTILGIMRGEICVPE